jgi:ferritin-like metal-binding protein YciE
MSFKSLDGLFVHELRDTLDVERQLFRARPSMTTATESEPSCIVFEDHREQTEHQVRRLAKIFDLMEKTP